MEKLMKENYLTYVKCADVEMMNRWQMEGKVCDKNKWIDKWMNTG